MPFYQYSCTECGQEFEKKLPMSQSGETQPCPGCGSMDTRKRLGSFAVSGNSTPARTSIPVSSPFT